MAQSDFEQAAQQRRPSLLADLVYFLSQNKKWWLLPFLLVLGLLALLTLASTTSFAPFIYTLF
jgi:hypothetical protein